MMEFPPAAAVTRSSDANQVPTGRFSKAGHYRIVDLKNIYTPSTKIYWECNVNKQVIILTTNVNREVTIR